MRSLTILITADGPKPSSKCPYVAVVLLLAPLVVKIAIQHFPLDGGDGSLA